MGWREFRAWLGERARQLRVQAEGRQMAPGSWDGYEQDGFFAAQREKHRKMRGRG